MISICYTTAFTGNNLHEYLGRDLCSLVRPDVGFGVTYDWSGKGVSTAALKPFARVFD